MNNPNVKTIKEPGVYELSARVYWNEKGTHGAAIKVNGEVVVHVATDEEEAGLSTLTTIDPDKDVVEVEAYGASQIKGPYASTTGKKIELR